MKYSILTIFALASTTIFAQTAKKDSTLHQSMTIERDFSPIVRDANKIDQQPEIIDINVKKTAARYADFAAPNVKSSAIGQMAAGQVIAEEERYKRGFVELSGGNYVNADLKAGINITSDLSTDFDAFFTKGDLDLPDQDLKWKSRYFDGNGKLNYSHSLISGGRLVGHIGGGGRNYNLFSFDDNMPTESLWRGFADFGYENETFSVIASFQHTGVTESDIQENSIHVKGAYGWYDNLDWTVKVGIDLGTDLSSEAKDLFEFMPFVEYSKYFNGMNRFYASATAGIRQYGLYNLMTKMPLVIPVKGYSPERTLADVTIGYEDNNNGAFKWGLFAEANIMSNRIDAVMCSPIVTFGKNDNGIPSTLEDEYDLYLLGCICNKKAIEIKAGGYFDAKVNKYFQMTTALDFNSNPRFGDGMVNVNAHIISNPIKKLTLDLSFAGNFKREMDYLDIPEIYNYNPESPVDAIKATTIDLKNNVDLGFRANYQLLENLSIFAFANNLLNNKYQLWAGIPAQGMNIHAGIYWKF